MPERKYTPEQISQLYDEWKKSGLDLKTFCATYTPTPLPYTTIYRRFWRFERKINHPPKDIPKPPEKTLEKMLLETITSEARQKYLTTLQVGEYISKHKNGFLKIIDKLIYNAISTLGERVCKFINEWAVRHGMNPKKYTISEIDELIKQNIDELAKQNTDLLQQIATLYYWKYTLKYERFPQTWEDLSTINIE